MRAWTEAYFYRTSRRADAVFASSQALLKKVIDVRGGGDGCDYLGNGVDFEHFQDGTTTAAARGVTNKERPRLGYLGALAPWLDYDAIAGLARAHPEWEIVLVGPILLGVEAQVLQVTELPNVFRLPAVPYDRVPETMAQFDVGLIPFRYNELTRGVNPNKLYEYFAAGLPVVATRFSEEVCRYPNLGRAVDPGPDFVRACEETIESLSDAERAADIAEQARRAARENDWNVIAGQFWDKVEALMQGGNAKESQHG
jgi:glycosyltransferase involved in cell wall biosynthesis